MTLRDRFTRTGALLGAGVLMASLAACGNSSSDSDNASADASGSTEELSGTLAGAGATSQQSAMDAWKSGFAQSQPGVTLSYDGVGSGAGVTQFTSGQVVWAGSDAALEGDQIAAASSRCGAAAWDLPVYISPIAIVFNLDGVTSLSLDADTVAKIFHGDITTWNDPAIAATNSGVTLPDETITPVHRSDESGTTENFTDYLHEAAPSVWTDEAGKSWPVEGGESAAKTSGVVQAVQAGKGSIGYVDASQAGQLGTVALGAKDGSFVSFSDATAAKAAETATRVEGRDANDIALKVNRIPDTNDSYPLILISYSIVCSTYSDANDAAMVKAFVGYQASSQGQEIAAQAAGSSPLSDTLRSEITTSLDAIK